MRDLPTILPLLRVDSTVLMPHSQLPISIPEEEYSSMAFDLIEDRIVAVVQPRPNFSKESMKLGIESCYACGCAGRISDIEVLDDEVSLTIHGICRFDIVEQIGTNNDDVERVLVNYSRYIVDIASPDSVAQQNIPKERLISALDKYFKNLNIFPNWNEIEKTPIDVLISALAMACPLHPSEKQTILELVDLKERSDIITKIIEINSFDLAKASNSVN